MLSKKVTAWAVALMVNGTLLAQPCTAKVYAKAISFSYLLQLKSSK